MKKIFYIKSLYIGVLTAIVILNIFLILRGIVIEKLLINEKELYKIKYEASKLMFIRDLELLSQDIALNNQQFKDHIGLIKSTKLVYAYSGDECSKCVFEDISLLKEKISKHKNSDVIVFPVMEDTRNVNIGLKSDLAGLVYKRLNKEYINFPRSNSGSSVRFFCIWDSLGKVSLPFFPEINSLERTEAYLDFVFAKYFARDENAKKISGILNYIRCMKL